MEILQLVDQLEQVLNRGWRVPFTASLVVNEEDCLRLIDQMRISVPSAIQESDRMIAERDRILNDARNRAEALVDRAEQEAEEMTAEHHVVQEAHREADRLVALGHAEALRLVQEAEEYALHVLQDLAAQLGTSLREAENGIRAIQEGRAASGSPRAPALPGAAQPAMEEEKVAERKAVPKDDEEDRQLPPQVDE